MPMTSPESTYCERSVRSTRANRSAGGRGHPVAGLQLRRKHDLDLREWLLRLGVLGDEHGRRPLLPVRSFTAREGDGAIPALELRGGEGLHQILPLVALGRVEGIGEQH